MKLFRKASFSRKGLFPYEVAFLKNQSFQWVEKGQKKYKKKKKKLPIFAKKSYVNPYQVTRNKGRKNGWKCK